ncbi:MAG: amidohydrolase family protein [Verrucomicrobia bacterium]|nr:amidohydrolase family protein [Verrucomicrobiota bacterium]
MSAPHPVIFQNCKLVFPDFFAEGSLRTEGGRIAAVLVNGNLRTNQAEVVDCAGDYLGPGFVDIHNHGATGTDFIDGEIDGLAAALRHHQERGSTSVLSTLITNPPSQILKTIRRHVAAERKGAIPGNFSGFHIEGPYLNPDKRGMHRIEWMHDPDPAEYQGWVEAGEGRVRLLTAAAERKGATKMYAWLRSRGVTGSIGHTTLSWECAQMAAAAGASHFVHVNNALEWPTRAKNNAGWMQTHTRGIGSFLTTDMFTGEVIADGYHVTPELIRVILATKGTDRLALVSDASPMTGMKPGRYTVATVEVEVRPGKLCLLADGSALASSVCVVHEMVCNLVGWGFRLLDAWRMASLTPARIAGLADRGALRVGAMADLVRLGTNLDLRGVWQGGRKV